MGVLLYIRRCADGAYYTGTTRSDLEKRISEHQAGTFPGFTPTRRPVELIYWEYFDQITDSIAAERKIKSWLRAKKEALIVSNFKNWRFWQRERHRSGTMVRDAALRTAPHYEE